MKLKYKYDSRTIEATRDGLADLAARGVFADGEIERLKATVDRLTECLGRLAAASSLSDQELLIVFGLQYGYEVTE